MISFWSVLSATLWFVVVYLFLFILRGHTTFLMKHGTAVWPIAVVLTIVRFLLPLDSKRMFVLRSYHLLPILRRALDYQPVTGISVSLLLKGLWLAGTLCGVGFIIYGVIRDSRRLRDIPAVPLTPEVRAAAQRCGIKPGMICMTPVFDGAKAMGLLHPTIYLPDRQFNETDLVCMLKHEMNHIAGHDAWLNLGFLLFRCVFWWNPLVYLAEKSVDDILELRCDKTTLDGMSYEERVAYIELMKLEGERKCKTPKTFVGASNFVSPERANLLLLRASEALNGPKRWDKAAVAALVLSIVLFAVSYVFILQPAELPPTTDDSDSVMIISPETSYLKALPSGDYELWCDGEFLWSVSADELNDSFYQNLEVLP